MNKWINHLTQNIWSLIVRIQNNSYTSININKLSSSSSAVPNQSSNNNNVTPMNWWFNLMLISNDINILHLVVIIIKTKDFVMSGNQNEKSMKRRVKIKKTKWKVKKKEQIFDIFSFWFFAFIWTEWFPLIDWLSKEAVRRLCQLTLTIITTTKNCEDQRCRNWIEPRRKRCHR